MRPLVLAFALASSAAHAAPIEVFPGAGTPIQNAIDGAGERALIRVHAGTYPEALVVNKRFLRLTAAGDGEVVINAGCAAPTALDIAADGVLIKGHGFFTAPITVRGGTGEQVRIEQRTGVRLSGVFARNDIDFPCSTGDGIRIIGGTRVRIDLSYARGQAVGVDVGIHIKGIAPDARITISGVRGSTTGNSMYAYGPTGVGLLLEDVATGRVRMHGLGIQGAGPGVRFINTSGALFEASTVVGGTRATDPVPALDLDAASANNVFKGNYFQARQGGPAVVDSGIGNCGRDNAFEPSGTLPACP